MNKAIEAMKRYLEQSEWPHEAHEDGLELRGAVSGGHWAVGGQSD